MTGETHKAGGVLMSIVGFAILRRKGLLLPDVNQGIQLLVIYPFCVWGSMASDLDHNEQAMPMKDLPSRIVHKALHLTEGQYRRLDESLSAREKRERFDYKLFRFFCARHRSWQTHSDFTLMMLFALYVLVISGFFTQFGAVDIAITSLVLIGIIMGVVAHLILDTLTPEGVYCFIWTCIRKVLLKLFPHMHLRKRFSLVPNTEYFATDGIWEQKIRRLIKFATKVAVIWFVWVWLYPKISYLIPFEFSFEYGG